MSTIRITVKGQVTLTDEILSHLGVQRGQPVTVNKLPSGAIEIRAAPTGRISDVFGSLKHRAKRRLSIKEINKIAADGWAGKR